MRPMKLVLASATIAALALAAIAPAAAAVNKEKLLNPAALVEQAPEKFSAKFDTSKGSFTIEVTRSWSPIGADRFYNLVKNGYFDGCRFFRVLDGFMAQFGINGDPELNKVWSGARIKDEPVKMSNKRGFVTFAKCGAPDCRSTQLFINFVDRNTFLDSQGFSPFGVVTEGMQAVDAINKEYGQTPDQQRIQNEGNAYLEKAFPNLDYIKTAEIVAGGAKPAAPKGEAKPAATKPAEKPAPAGEPK